MADAGEKKVAMRKKKTYEKREPRVLEPEQILKSEKGTEYLVDCRLGAGGFGEVWKVSLLKEPEKRFAMKTEPNVAERKSMLRLKCEVSLFEEIARASNRLDKNHFVKMYDKGKTIDFKYFVMDLIWMSLGDIRHKICGGSFTPHTKIQIARQMLKAIEALHEIGYLHRDIKPANVAVGLPPKDSIVYLIDFGIARPYRDKDGAVKAARSTVRFMGTKRYASMEALCQKEQARRDDLEVWMYMMIEMYDEGNLTWCDLENEGQDQKHIDLRMELMQTPRKSMAAGDLRVPDKWIDIIELLNSMAFDDAGDFTQLNLILSQICVDENIDENLPLDWIGKKAKSPEKPKKIEPKEEKKREKGGLRKKKTKEKKEGEEDRPPRKQRRRRKTDDESSSGDDSESGDSDDYEAYLRWKKKRRNKKKRQSNDRASNEHSERRRLRPRKKASKEKKDQKDQKKEEAPILEVDAKDLTILKMPEINLEEKKEVDKKPGNLIPGNLTPEKNEVCDDKDGKRNKTPEIKPPEVKNTPQFDKKNVLKKKNDPVQTPEPKDESNNDREDKGKKGVPKLTKKDGTPESNESNNDREDKVKKKKKNRTPESNDDDEKKINGKKLKDWKKKREEKPAEKPLAAKPELKKANEVIPAKKSDDKKK